MKQSAFREFSIDNASILFLSLLRPHHTNIFRFSVQLHQPVCPETLQQAVNRLHPRFPSVIAGFQQRFFRYKQVAAETPPVVRPDPGALLPMSREELAKCAFRVFYQGNTITLELFHALTDGHGTLMVFSSLLSEYLRLSGSTEKAMGHSLYEQPQPYEVMDSYAQLATVKPRQLPSRFSYLLPRPADADWQVRNSTLTLDTTGLLDAAHRHGVTLNTLLTTLLAQTVMQMQLEDASVRQLKPVRIMVPVDIRRLTDGRTLRNCALYTLPTMEPHHRNLNLTQLCVNFHAQLKQQLSPENLSAMASFNVRSQNRWYFRMLPWKLKAAALRLGYRFFGESNSSLTLTNLGRVSFPQELMPHIADIRCTMLPRVTSPYGCTVMTFGDKLTLNMSRFCPSDQLGSRYFSAVRSLVE